MMTLALTFTVMMVVSFMMMITDALASSELQTLTEVYEYARLSEWRRAIQAGNCPTPSGKMFKPRPKVTEPSFQNALVEIFQYLDEVEEIETLFDMLAHPESHFPQSSEDFEDAIFHASQSDYSQLAASLLAKPKPQRDARGRFKASRSTSQTEETLNRMAPIPSGFSFF